MRENQNLMTTQPNTTSNSIIQSMFWKPLNMSILEKIVKKSDRNKGSGYDGLLPKTFIDNFPWMKHVLLKLVTLIIKQGEIPDRLKVGLVSPVYKNGRKNELTQYRPIAVQNFVTKIIETHINDSMRTHIPISLVVSHN